MTHNHENKQRITPVKKLFFTFVAFVAAKISLNNEKSHIS